MPNIIPLLVGTGQDVLSCVVFGNQRHSSSARAPCSCHAELQAAVDDCTSRRCIETSLPQSESPATQQIGESGSRLDETMVISNQPLLILSFHDNFYDGFSAALPCSPSKVQLGEHEMRPDCPVCSHRPLKTSSRLNCVLTLLSPCRFCGASTLCACRDKFSDLYYRTNFVSYADRHLTFFIRDQTTLPDLHYLPSEDTCTTELLLEVSHGISPRTDCIQWYCSQLKHSPDSTKTFIRKNVLSFTELHTTPIPLLESAASLSVNGSSEENWQRKAVTSQIDTTWYCSRRPNPGHWGSCLCACLRQVLAVSKARYICEVTTDNVLACTSRPQGVDRARDLIKGVHKDLSHGSRSAFKDGVRDGSPGAVYRGVGHTRRQGSLQVKLCVCHGWLSDWLHFSQGNKQLQVKTLPTPPDVGNMLCSVFID